MYPSSSSSSLIFTTFSSSPRMFTVTVSFTSPSNPALLSSSFSLLHLNPKARTHLHLPPRFESQQPPQWKGRCNAQLSLSEIAPAASAVYGTFLFGGGLFAYLKSGSKGSILGGSTGGALMALAYYLMQNPETKVAGDAIGFGSAFLFSAVFAIRLASTKKPVPAGPLLGLSLGAMAVFVSAYLQDKI